MCRSNAIVEGGPSPHSSISVTRPQRRIPARENTGMRLPQGGNERGPVVDQEMETSVKPAGYPASLRTESRPSRKQASNLDCRKLNARSVEFIAKAGLSSKLRDSIERALWKSLNRRPGFAGAAVLTADKEPRRILILTFWKTERECAANNWDFAREIQKEAGPLIDAFSRVQTYKANISQPLPSGQTGESAQPC